MGRYLLCSHLRVHMPHIGAQECAQGYVVQRPQSPTELRVARVEQLQSVTSARLHHRIGATLLPALALGIALVHSYTSNAQTDHVHAPRLTRTHAEC